MSFILYDIIFLVLFTLAVAIFLYKRKHNLKREGLLFLYRTKVGIKVIDSITQKFSRILKPMQYLIIGCGYALMIAIIGIFIRFAYFYLTSSEAVKALKVPVIMPLIPYLPDLFNIEFLPPFYFTYWILIIAVIAVSHEFAHGIFMRLNKIRILSTGFGFLGPFLAAFVEQDEKQMKKAKKFSQLSILAAGTFANVLATIVFGLILWLFFVSAFTPAGVNFNTYSVSMINVSAISAISFLSPETPQNFTFAMISAGNRTYFADKGVLEAINASKTDSIAVFDDSPAFNAKLAGAIAEINGKKILSLDELNKTLSSYKPGDKITIRTIVKNKTINSYELTLAEKNGRAFLGIGLIPLKSSGFFSKFYLLLAKIKDPFVYYESKIGDFGIFIFNLLWWITLLNISVALMNMLPAGMFDGGRFFYLTILGITKKEKIAKWVYRISTWTLLILVAFMIIRWIFAFL